MILEQLQNKLLPILFDNNDKFEDINRANILYDEDLDQLTIKRTKFDFGDYRRVDLETLNKLIKIIGYSIRINYSGDQEQIIFIITNPFHESFFQSWLS